MNQIFTTIQKLRKTNYQTLTTPWFILLLLLCNACSNAQNVNAGCSIWRRDVKTLQDISSSSVSALLNTSPKTRTVAAMNKETLTIEGVPTQLTNGRQWENVIRQPSEKELISVHAKVIECGKEGNDHDYHIVLQDIQTNEVMVAEIPSPDCTDVTNPVLRKRYAALRDWFDANVQKPTSKVLPLPQPIIVTVIGVPFWDGKHPGEVHGAAANFREIHPVLDFIAGGHHAIQ